MCGQPFLRLTVLRCWLQLTSSHNMHLVFRNLLELQFSDLQTVSEMVAVSLNGGRSKLELCFNSHLVT